jgi:hypothetical protein
VALAAGASGTATGASGSGSTAGATTAKSVTSPTQPADPAALVGGDLPTSPWLPLVALLLILAIPVVILSVKRKHGAAEEQLGVALPASSSSQTTGLDGNAVPSPEFHDQS